MNILENTLPHRATRFEDEITVVLFAGAGGSDEGIEAATGRPVAVAINHDENALSMHRANHPHTEHLASDVYEVDPRAATRGRPVGILHASPDCTHHSQAKGGQPRNKAVRSLSWVVRRWAGTVRPRLITMECVVQLQVWGGLIAKRCPETGRVVKLDRSVAAPGERVPVHQQFLVPNPKQKGRTWHRFVQSLRDMGYAVQWRTLLAADYGVGQTRDRLFLIARCDGEPIVFPQPSHHAHAAGGKSPWIGAAECIEWHHPCPSIFERKRPLKPATTRRIAKGIKRFVLDHGDPFILPIANWSRDTAHSIREPLRTVTAWPRGGSFALVAPTLAHLTHQGSERIHSPRGPLPTVTGANRGEIALIAATAVRADAPQPRVAQELFAGHLAQMNGGKNTTPGHDLRRPSSTITTKGCQQQLVAAHLVHLRNNCDARNVREPLRTLSAGGEHHGLAATTLVQREPANDAFLSPPQHQAALCVARFLLENLGEAERAATLTEQELLEVVTVQINGHAYVIVDVGLRMLHPRELFNASSFRKDFIIDRGHDGRRFTRTQQVRFVGNAVPPKVQEAVIRANYPQQQQLAKAA